MRVTGNFLTFAAGLVMSACIPSLHPLYVQRDLVLAPELEGTWVEAVGEDTWTFQKGAGNDYKLIHKEKGEPGNFDVHMVRLGKFLFLDIYPQPPDVKNDFYRGHLIRCHSLWRLSKILARFILKAPTPLSPIAPAKLVDTMTAQELSMISGLKTA
ncbi:MAG TPA: hypothetical protein VGL91_04070 [Acidobacteriota bacterium]|jgi:hypothetical protein